MAITETQRARRIVACVNACTGISTEQLERGKAGFLQRKLWLYEAIIAEEASAK